MNYIKQGAIYTGKKREDISEDEQGFFFTAFNRTATKPRQTKLQLTLAYTELGDGHFKEQPREDV